MFKFALTAFGLILWLTQPQQGEVFRDGFEGSEMYSSTDRPDISTWTIGSTHSNAAFVTSSTYLNDGKVALPTRMTWDVGTQSTSVQVYLQAGAFSKTISVGDKLVIAMFCPKTAYAIPADVLINTLYGSDTSLTGGPDAYTFETNNGAVVSIVVIDVTQTIVDILNGGSLGTDATWTKFYIFINNKTSAVATWAASGQTFDIGEVWFGTLQEFKNTSDPQIALIDPTTNRRSHNNTPQALFKKPYRQGTFDFAPMSRSIAYVGSNNFEQVRYALSQAESALILPRIYAPGTTTIDTDDLHQLAMFGRPDSIDPLRGMRDATDLWTARMTFSEAPP